MDTNKSQASIAFRSFSHQRLCNQTHREAETRLRWNDFTELYYYITSD